MGREIRRVPLGWEHPRYTENDCYDKIGQLRPCYDQDFPTASAEWREEYAKWKPEEHDGMEYWEYANAPDRETCRPMFTEEPTWWVVYETVSEGTPVTPAFATAEELIDYLTKHGDYWAQEYGDAPPSREACEKFVKGSGWAPSMMIVDGTAKMGIAACDEFKDETTERR
jgi:hypothetical protein